MTAKERLHRLVDLLPDGEAGTAERVLEALAHAAPRLPDVLRNAPPDDEPDNDDFDGGLTEARAEMGAGKGIPHEDVKRMFGLT